MGKNKKNKETTGNLSNAKVKSHSENIDNRNAFTEKKIIK